jgi:hypothetical protein
MMEEGHIQHAYKVPLGALLSVSEFCLLFFIFFPSVQGFRAVQIYIEVFWYITPCSLVDGYQRFGGTYCVHLMDRRWRQHIPPKRWSPHTRLDFTVSQPRRATVCVLPSLCAYIYVG